MSKKITNEDIEKAVVKLKPIMNISPGVYLTVIYAAILLVALFFIFLFPGIYNNGTVLTIESTPTASLVWIDDYYKGSTPLTIKVPRGIANIRIEKEYFESVNLEEKTGGRIFATLFFPVKKEMKIDMNLSDTSGFLKERFRKLSSYSLIEDYYDRYQFPPLISTTVKEYIDGTNAKDPDKLYDFLYSMRVNLGSPDEVADYIKAIRYLNNDQNLNNDVGIIFNYFSKENNFSALALSLINAFPVHERDKIVTQIEKYGELETFINKKNIEINDFINTISENKNFITVNSLKFIGVNGGNYLSGVEPGSFSGNLFDNSVLNNFPALKKIRNFYILQNEIQIKDYSKFIEANPKWSLENLSNLIEQGLVTSDYLQNQDFSKENLPVSNISWYAAKAYCNWLESGLPAYLEGYRVRLPYEEEWEAAAYLNEETDGYRITHDTGAAGALPVEFSRSGKIGIYDLLGNLWEWNENWYFPNDSINGSYGLRNSKWSGVEKAVRGGSWANNRSDINIVIRGSQDPSWCTPFTGFRPVLVKSDE